MRHDGFFFLFSIFCNCEQKKESWVGRKCNHGEGIRFCYRTIKTDDTSLNGDIGGGGNQFFTKLPLIQQLLTKLFVTYATVTAVWPED